MLSAVDNTVIFLCILGILGIGYYFSKTSQSMDSFYKANRALPWSLVVGTLMASWYSGSGIIGTVGYASTMGFAAFFIWSIGAHAVRFPLALWVAPRISVKAKGTIPDLLRRNYGKLSAVLGSIVLVISCLSIGEVAAVGYVGEAAWDQNKVVVAGIVVAVSIGITCLGGLMGVAVTDMIFFFLMVVCVSSVFPKMFFGVGGIEGFHAVLDTAAPEMMTPLGGIPWAQAAVLIILCINLYKDPTFYQRFSAANSPKTGKRAMLTCFSIWLSFDVVTQMTGTIVRVMDPSLAVQPEVRYIQLVLENLPVGVRGLFIVGILGAIVSTLDSYYLVGGEIISNDIIYMIRGDKRLPDKLSIRITRFSAVIFGVVGLATAFRFDRVYDAFLFLTSISMTLLFVPVIAALMFDGKKTNVAGLASMIVGAVSWIFFQYICPVYAGDYMVDPVIIGLPLSFIAFLIGNRFGVDLNAKRRLELEKAGTPVEDDQLTPEFKEEIKVRWIGIDGALVLLYIVLACIYGYGLIHSIDWIIGYMAPGVAMAIATGVFLKYCTEVFSFATGKKGK
ncbi:MAG: sodium:solute symporter family protein [Lachnospiraceae bacterium]|jgi:SSS family solute:Na+ symporter